jgi:hypothetical protein
VAITSLRFPVIYNEIVNNYLSKLFCNQLLRPYLCNPLLKKGRKKVLKAPEYEGIIWKEI